MTPLIQWVALVDDRGVLEAIAKINVAPQPIGDAFPALRGARAVRRGPITGGELQKRRNLFLQTVQAVALGLQHREQPALRLNAPGRQAQKWAGCQRRAIANVKSSIRTGLNIRHVGDGIRAGYADAGVGSSGKEDGQQQETTQPASEH
jgi:hypothetical protein